MIVDGMGDEQLLRQASSGQEAAFSALYRRWQGGIYRYSLRLSGSASIAEDVTQEVFLALMDRTFNYDPGLGSFAAYLYGIARNQVLRRMARERVFAPLAEGTEEEREVNAPARNAHSDPLDSLARQESIDLLLRAVAALPLRYREVVVLCELQELSYGESAQVIGCPEGTIRSRLHRARVLLLEKLQEMARADTRAPGIEPARCLL
jgi:RNA polymerase sigma-70 factor (ECF subfamily)